MNKAGIIFWLSTASAGVGAIYTTLLATPGDGISSEVLVVLGAISAALAAMVAMATRQPG